MAKPTRKFGRPTKFKPEYVEQARKLCELGATDRELAEFFKVKEQTVNNWKAAYPDFFEALKLGKDAADKRVEQSLYRRALGYSHDSVHVTNFQGAVTLTPIVEHFPPDTTACIFWLKNRKPEQWRDLRAVEHAGSIQHQHTFAQQLEAARARAIQAAEATQH